MSNPLFFLIYTVIDIYIFLLFVYVIISLLISFDIINRQNNFIQQVSYALFKLFEPVLKRIRPHMPDLGMLDISVLVLFVIAQTVRYTVYWVENTL